MFNFLKRKKNNIDTTSFIENLVDKEIREHGIEAVAARANKYTDNLIERDGFEETASLYAEVINKNKIHSHKVALQFVLEELDAARQGNDTALLWHHCDVEIAPFY